MPCARAAVGPQRTEQESDRFVWVMYDSHLELAPADERQRGHERRILIDAPQLIVPSDPMYIGAGPGGLLLCERGSHRELLATCKFESLAESVSKAPAAERAASRRVR